MAEIQIYGNTIADIYVNGYIMYLYYKHAQQYVTFNRKRELLGSH